MDQFWSSAEEIYHLFSVPINIAITIIVAVIIRYILLAISHKVLRRYLEKLNKKNGATQAPAGVPAKVAADRQMQRTQTMAAVGDSFITWAIVGVVLVQIMSELGVSLPAILASAGIVTAALGFGAQNVVKDALNGIFMVVEDQFGVGDTVDLGHATGVVENVSVRITTLRSDDGTVWFVRNGEIARVGNLTYGASVKAPVLRTTNGEKQAAKKAAVKKSTAKKVPTKADMTPPPSPGP
jgi:small conductance mechanosensitive channel